MARMYAACRDGRRRGESLPRTRGGCRSVFETGIAGQLASSRRLDRTVESGHHHLVRFTRITVSSLKALRAHALLADAHARELAAVLARFREEVALLGITEQELRVALGYEKSSRSLEAKYYDPVTGKQLEVYAIDAPQPQPRWPGED